MIGLGCTLFVLGCFCFVVVVVVVLRGDNIDD